MAGRQRLELSGKPEERFLDPKQITAALDYLLTRSSDLSFALLGGVAMQVYGSDRFTTDVDVVADTDAIGKPPLSTVRPLKFGGARFKLAKCEPVACRTETQHHTSQGAGAFKATVAMLGENTLRGG